MKKILIHLFVLLVVMMPTFSLAQFQGPCPSGTYNNGTSCVPNQGLVSCGKSGQPECNFKDFITLINTIIHFVLFNLVVPISAIMFFYAGFKLVTSGGSTEARGTAKKVFTSTVMGLIIAAAAWLIIRTILSILSPTGTHPWAWIGF